MKSWWVGLSFRGSSSFILAKKLKKLKGFLKSWNSEVFGNVTVRKNLALTQVGFWDSKELLGTLTIEEETAREASRIEFRKWAFMEETSWRQKSREVWLKEGDRNTKFFHKMANAHRRRNFLAKIKINGAWLT